MEHYIDYKSLAKGFGLTQAATKKFLKDGRIIGRLGEFIVERKLSGKRTNEGSFDVTADNGAKIEVRSLTDKVCFAASSEIGSGRQVTEEGYSKKLESLDYYIVVNFEKDILKFYNVYKSDLEYMENRKMLNSNKEIRRDRFLNYIASKDESGAPSMFFTSSNAPDILDKFLE